jgi:hypothetical protein
MSDATPIQRMVEEQERMRELVGGGAIARVVEQQKQIADSLAGTAFGAYRNLAAETVEAIGAEVPAEEGSSAPLGQEDYEWIPTKEQAAGLADIALFIVALLWFCVALAQVDFPETTRLGVEALLAFAIVMTRFAR